MARFGIEPGELGTLDERTTSQGQVQGYFIPKSNPAPGTATASLPSAGVKLVEFSRFGTSMTIYPTETRSWRDNFLGPKYSQITEMTLEGVVVGEDLLATLEELPSGFTKNYEYGLGLARDCDVLVSLIEGSTDCLAIDFVVLGDPEVDGDRFRISFSRFDALRAELNRIRSRGNGGVRRAKQAFIHNDLAETLGLQPRKLSLGRLPISKWLTQVAAGQMPLNDAEQDDLVATTTAGAAQMAARIPERMIRLQRDIEVANLDQLIASYADGLAAGHNEDWWQHFFEENVFALQLLFGGPTVFIEAQTPIGDSTNSAKGKKIADYLLRNAMTNNAALVEIKKPSTRLVKKRPYREGVYGVQAEISEAITQVLDQALQLTRHEDDTKQRTTGDSWVSVAPRCFVVAGRVSELDTDDKKKSFELYREHLSGVRIVAYDEVLEQLKTLRDFLAVEDDA